MAEGGERVFYRRFFIALFLFVDATRDRAVGRCFPGDWELYQRFADPGQSVSRPKQASIARCCWMPTRVRYRLSLQEEAGHCLPLRLCYIAETSQPEETRGQPGLEKARDVRRGYVGPAVRDGDPRLLRGGLLAIMTQVAVRLFS